MQQVVDLQSDEAFKKLGVQLVAISPDPVTAWRQDGGALGITVPMLSDQGNTVWVKYGIPSWMMPTGEPGHTFFLVGNDGKIVWLRDYGAPEHGGAMYVAPNEIVSQVQQALAGS
jgi:peroxiredoxin